MIYLKLDNYRSFRDTILPLSRVNIIIGENSSGKSSILKFFLILKQSLSNFRSSILTISGEEVDLGNFKDMIYFHDIDKTLNFGFGIKEGFYDYCNNFFNKPKEQNRKEPFSILKQHFDSFTYADFEIGRDLTSLKSLNVYFRNSSLGYLTLNFTTNEEDNNDEMNLPKSRLNIIYKNKGRNKEYLLTGIGFDNQAYLNFVQGSDLQKNIEENYPDDQIIYYEIAMLLLSQNYIEDFINSFSYVNPISSKPERIYYKRDKRRFSNAIDLPSLINLLDDENILRFFKTKLMPIIKEFGLAEDIDLINNEQLPVVELKVKIQNLWSNINDVGYGVAIQLPILLHSLMMEIGKTKRIIMIEQPEVHLHPKLQAKFIEALLSIGKRNSYIIETHSEHIVRKLQILIKNKSLNLKPADINIFYLKREKENSTVTEHKIDEFGNLSPRFPDGFYDTSYNLAKELL